MSSNQDWREYVAHLRGDDTDKQFAERVGVSASTVSRWMAGLQEVKAEQVIAVARAYSQSPVAALRVAGFLTEAEFAAVFIPTTLSLREFTDLELAQEIVRRIEDGESTTLDQPFAPPRGLAPLIPREALVSDGPVSLPTIDQDPELYGLPDGRIDPLDLFADDVDTGRVAQLGLAAETDDKNEGES